MATQLSEGAERRIADRVASGAFPTADAVIEEALSALDWFEERKAIERAWLEGKLARAVESADRGEFIDKAEFEARMDSRLASRRNMAA